VKGQSIKSPTGDVPVAETERPRLGRAIRAWPSTVTGTRSAPKCDGVAARLSQRVTKCINKYRLCTKNASSSTLERACLESKFIIPTDEILKLPTNDFSRGSFTVDPITVLATIENPIEPVPPCRCTRFTEAIRKTFVAVRRALQLPADYLADVRRISIVCPTTNNPARNRPFAVVHHHRVNPGRVTARTVIAINRRPSRSAVVPKAMSCRTVVLSRHPIDRQIT